MKHITKLGIAFISTLAVFHPSASLANSGSTTADVPALSAGIVAPTIGGTDGVAGKSSLSNTLIVLVAVTLLVLEQAPTLELLSAHPQHLIDVTSTAKFGISGSTIDQVIGTKNTVEAPITTYGIEEQSESLSTTS